MRLFGTLLALLVGWQAWGLVNVRFTPVDLVRQSRNIVVCRLEPGTDGKTWRLKVVETIKGDATGVRALDLGECKDTQREDVSRVIELNGAEAVLIFTWGDETETRGFLHASGNWFGLTGKNNGRWSIREFDLKMGGTFAGGTDMLIRMCRYIQRDPQAEVPVSVGVGWLGSDVIAQTNGQVRGLTAVRLDGGDHATLFVASDIGDRLFRLQDGKWRELTSDCGLSTRSDCFTWLDANGDGLADLASLSGTRLDVLLQTAGGKLVPVAKATLNLRGPGHGLYWLGNSPAGLARILVTTPSLPYLVEWNANAGRELRVTDLQLGGKTLQEIGGLVSCVVADFDNDGFVDILEIHTEGSFFRRGKPDGFARPEECAVRAGGIPGYTTVGDFDADGSLDIFLGSPACNGLWENDGKGHFRDVINLSGSLGYKTAAGLSSCLAADLNHDGRTDLALCYTDAGLIYHFNRGFRCFAEEGELRLSEAGEGAPEEGIGVRQCVVADFNMDGADDLVVVLTDGTLRCFFGDCVDAPGIRVRVDKSFSGPVTVSLWQNCGEAMCMGTWVLNPCSPPQRMSAPHAGPCTLRWSAPGLLGQGTAVVADVTHPLVTLRRK